MDLFLLRIEPENMVFLESVKVDIYVKLKKPTVELLPLEERHLSFSSRNDMIGLEESPYTQ